VHTPEYLLFFGIPFLISSFCFTVFDMDASSPRKKLLLEYQGIVKSIDKLPLITQGKIIESFKNVIKNSHKDIINSYTTVSDKNHEKLTKSINSASELIASALRDAAPLEKENVMPEEEKEPEKQEPVPPTPPEPPEPRDLIESQNPDIKTEK